METVLYFQSQAKVNAAEKLSGVQDVAAKCGWFVQIVPKCPSAKLLRARILGQSDALSARAQGVCVRAAEAVCAFCGE